MAKMKGIYRRGTVYWIRYAGLDGRIRHESSGSTSFKDAKDTLTSRRNDVTQGKQPLPIKKIGNHSFKELAAHYEGWVERQRSFRTKRNFIKQLVAEFGNLPLRAFNTRLIEEWQTRRLQKNKPATVNRLLATLKHMFSKAVEWDMIEEEVLKRVRRVKLIPENNRRLRYLSKEEAQAFISACSPTLRPIVITALNTGMRKEEILSLEWEKHVDLKHGFILLDKTKSGHRREIPINRTLRECLQGLIRHINSPSYVFVDKHGKRFKAIKRSFATALKKAEIERCMSCHHERQKTDAKIPGNCPMCGSEMTRRGIEDFKFHDLRHTFASQLVMAGVDLTTVRELLGHATLTMTLRYAHLAHSHVAKAVAVLDSGKLERGRAGVAG